jgi:hypothetical protein
MGDNGCALHKLENIHSASDTGIRKIYDFRKIGTADCSNPVRAIHQNNFRLITPWPPQFC